MDAIIDFFMESPLPLVFVGSHYLYYALLALAVLAVRLATGRLTRPEGGLLALFGVCLAVELLQLSVDGVKFLGGETWGLPRYFGVFAPLLWGWAAYALARLWALPPKGWARLAVRGAVAAAVVWVLVSENIGQIRPAYEQGAVPDVMQAARGAGRLIRQDYAGPRRQAEPKRTMNEYFTANRPVVFSDFAAAAWLLRGQSEGAMQGRGLCPYPDDYLFVRVGTGYGSIETVSSRVYDYVGRVQGVGTEWRLFRRKTTPHRAAAR